MTANPEVALLMPAEPFAQDLTSSMLVFGAKLLDNPSVGERFATAYLKAVRQYTEGKTPRNVELVATYTKLEPTLVEKMCWPTTASDGAVNVESIMAYQAWLQTQNALDRLVTPDEFLDTHYAEAANKLLGGGSQ
jgi:NitT/TauT family transport system substrate-binding protein